MIERTCHSDDAIIPAAAAPPGRFRRTSVDGRVNHNFSSL
jgi:hypothetical protein